LAISVPLSKQTACKTIAQKAVAAGFEGIQLDGNDVIACRDVVAYAIEKARRGEGPTLIEALTYRLCDHTTADDATRYQPAEEVKEAQLKEPINRLRHFLEKRNLWDDNQEKQLHNECNQVVQQQVDEYLNRAPQTIQTAFDYHYATLPDYLIEQRAIAMEEAANA
jgi:2-oxoisovalerate dehydrogenase E1 component alpha subunit